MPLLLFIILVIVCSAVWNYSPPEDYEKEISRFSQRPVKMPPVHPALS